ncbi:hypothetical protein RchiOBHm_Chr2g0120591 [Rosa chinensis]|uniref:Uncharacterized protein n=1 Tax=Rosa chinensis TaxID=74649 RepID=A0A2P6RSB5_ROSCH|nr:hypothetical protein RchiOBHm_Chr2g0120591 [Rosa chinensis]
MLFIFNLDQTTCLSLSSFLLSAEAKVEVQIGEVQRDGYPWSCCGGSALFAKSDGTGDDSPRRQVVRRLDGCRSGLPKQRSQLLFGSRQWKQLQAEDPRAGEGRGSTSLSQRSKSRFGSKDAGD